MKPYKKGVSLSAKGGYKFYLKDGTVVEGVVDRTTQLMIFLKNDIKIYHSHIIDYEVMRISKHIFGYCEICGEGKQIHKTTRRCPDCQTKVRKTYFRVKKRAYKNTSIIKEDLEEYNQDISSIIKARVVKTIRAFYNNEYNNKRKTACKCGDNLIENIDFVDFSSRDFSQKLDMLFADHCCQKCYRKMIFAIGKNNKHISELYKFAYRIRAIDKEAREREGTKDELDKLVIEKNNLTKKLVDKGESIGLLEREFIQFSRKNGKFSARRLLALWINVLKDKIRGENKTIANAVKEAQALKDDIEDYKDYFKRED